MAVLLWSAPLGQAHDLITGELAERYLAQIQSRLDVLHSEQPVPLRALAATQLGRTLDEIHRLLNRDLVERGRIHGLATEYLVRELEA
ncbi:MAG TPA: hypothetical protein VML56_02345, partial [Burkholderiales bacterium]|nr:hypothetical protein [Burkholderiales bacterium]